MLNSGVICGANWINRSLAPNSRVSFCLSVSWDHIDHFWLEDHDRSSSGGVGMEYQGKTTCHRIVVHSRPTDTTTIDWERPFNSASVHWCMVENYYYSKSCHVWTNILIGRHMLFKTNIILYVDNDRYSHHNKLMEHCHWLSQQARAPSPISQSHHPPLGWWLLKSPGSLEGSVVCHSNNNKELILLVTCSYNNVLFVHGNWNKI